VDEVLQKALDQANRALRRAYGVPRTRHHALVRRVELPEHRYGPLRSQGSIEGR